MYYPSSENKGADQLRGYREADLRLCFRICRLLVFPRDGSNLYFKSCKNKFSHDVAYIELLIFEPLRDKTIKLGFRPGQTQTSLYSHRSRLET